MQIEQVIRNLRAAGLLFPKDKGDFLFEAARMLEKEIARTPTFRTQLQRACPFCGQPVCFVLDKVRCRSCGQVLDWRGEDG